MFNSMEMERIGAPRPERMRQLGSFAYSNAMENVWVNMIYIMPPSMTRAPMKAATRRTSGPNMQMNQKL